MWKLTQKFLKKLKIEPLYDTAIPLLNKYLKEIKLDVKKIFAPSCLLQQNSQYPKNGNNLNVHQLINDKENIGHNGILVSLKNFFKNPVICINMDGNEDLHV